MSSRKTNNKLPSSRKSSKRGSIVLKNQKPINLLFRNYTSKDVSIYWIDFDGTPHLYYQLWKGHEQPQKTYEGHKWIIRDSASHKLIMEYFVNPEPEESNQDRKSMNDGVSSNEKSTRRIKQVHDTIDEYDQEVEYPNNKLSDLLDSNLYNNDDTEIQKSQDYYSKKERPSVVDVDDPIESWGDSVQRDLKLRPSTARPSTSQLQSRRDANNKSNENAKSQNDMKEIINEATSKVRVIPILEIDIQQEKKSKHIKKTSPYEQDIRPQTSRTYKSSLTTRNYGNESQSARQNRAKSSRKRKSTVTSSPNKRTPENRKLHHKIEKHEKHENEDRKKEQYSIQFIQKNKIITVKESPFDEAIEKCKSSNELFKDEHFTPSKKNAGPKSPHVSWKRLSEIIQHCRLFEEVDSSKDQSSEKKEQFITERNSEIDHSVVSLNKETNNSSQIHNDSELNISQKNPDLEIQSLIELADESDFFDDSLNDQHLLESPTLENSRSKEKTSAYSSPRTNGKTSSHLTSPAKNKSHVKNTEVQEDIDSIDNVEENPLLKETFNDLRDLNQGCFSLSWLMHAFGAIASEHMSTLKKIIHGEPEYGLYSVTLHYNGTKVIILVDDYVPVDSNDVCCFSRPWKQNIIWPCILEKALAKLVGSYSALIPTTGFLRSTNEFNISSVLASVLGGKSRWMDWGKDDPTGKETQRLIEDHFLWSTLLRKNRVLVLTPKQSCSMGLVSHHGYHLLDVMHIERTRSNSNTGLRQKKMFNLFLIRNSFGKSTWHGSWSQQDKIWGNYPEVKENLYLKSDQDGSLFWMELKDLKKNFDILWFN